VVAFNEIEVRILHFFKSAYVGLAARRPRQGVPPGGVVSRAVAPVARAVSLGINGLRSR
jgi:hypothetical protein